MGLFNRNKSDSRQTVDESLFPRASRVLEEGIRSQVSSAVFAGFWSQWDPDKAWSGALGQTCYPDLGFKQTQVHTRTLFDIASLTKAVATASLTGILIDRKWLDWETPVSAFFPEQEHFKDINISHLLTHTAGYSAWAPFYLKLRTRAGAASIERFPIRTRQEWMREEVLAFKPEVPPGQRVLYSDLSALLLGFVLENVTQMDLDAAVDTYVFRPMGLESAHYRPVVSMDRDPKIPATENSDWRGGIVQGLVHDENCWAMGGVAGHAGVFCHGMDLLKYVEQFYSGFFSPETLQKFFSSPARPEGCARTYGWDRVTQPGSTAGDYFSTRSIGHLGFTGTSLWMDPDAGLAVVLLTNRVHPTRENDRIRAFRIAFHNANSGRLERAWT